MDEKTYPESLIDEEFAAYQPGQRPLVEPMKCVYAGPEFFNPAPVDPDDERRSMRGMGMLDAQDYVVANAAADRKGAQDEGQPARFCPMCGAKNSAASKFCVECGSPLSHD